MNFKLIVSSVELHDSHAYMLKTVKDWDTNLNIIGLLCIHFAYYSNLIHSENLISNAKAFVFITKPKNENSHIFHVRMWAK